MESWGIRWTTERWKFPLPSHWHKLFSGRLSNVISQWLESITNPGSVDIAKSLQPLRMNLFELFGYLTDLDQRNAQGFDGWSVSCAQEFLKRFLPTTSSVRVSSSSPLMKLGYALPPLPRLSDDLLESLWGQMKILLHGLPIPVCCYHSRHRWPSGHDSKQPPSNPLRIHVLSPHPHKSVNMFQIQLCVVSSGDWRHFGKVIFSLIKADNLIIRVLMLESGCEI